MRLKRLSFPYIAVTVTFCLTVGGMTFLYSKDASSQSVHTPITTEYSNASDELVLLWKTDTNEDVKEDILAQFPQAEVIKSFDNFMCLKADSLTAAEEIKNALVLRPELSAIDYNQELSLTSTNDPYSSTQWGFHNTGHYMQIVDNKMISTYSAKDVDLEIPEAWNLYKKSVNSSREVIVAIIDTGVDYQHPELVDNMWMNTTEIPGDGIDNDGDGYIDDIYGWDFYNDDNTVCHYQFNPETNVIEADSKDKDNHGTHIAGIIAAEANNGQGIAGIASNVDVKIMSLKIHGGTNAKGKVGDAILAIKYATMHGAEICNMSWGSTVYNSTLEKAISEAPMLFVTAAGNTGDNNDYTPMYPANYDLPNVISVTFINQYGALTTKSNFGKDTVDIAAPGIDIFSTIVNGYDTMSGSSMAAPHVTGLAAMLFAVSDNIDPASVKNIILDNIKPLDALAGMINHSGIPNAYNMVRMITSLSVDTQSPTIKHSASFNQSEIELNIDAADEGSGVRVMRYLKGIKSTDDFKKGTYGLELDGSMIPLNKAGWYTVYASDYCGNESCVSLEIKDDTTAPSIVSDFKYSYNTQKFTINASIKDKQSGVKLVKYMKGSRTIEDFRKQNSGTVVSVENNKATFRISNPGIYTIYAVDYRGNKTVHVMNVDVSPITSLRLAGTVEPMNVNDTKKLQIKYAPMNTTERIYYVSSNPSILSVSQWGLMHAKSPGTAVVSVHTTGGLVRKIKITVK